MKLKHKILTLIAGTLTTFALTSCNDFLDRDPLGQFTEDDAPNALIGGKMYNVYYLMRSYNITAGIPAFMIHMVRSEDSEKGSDAGDGAALFNLQGARSNRGTGVILARTFPFVNSFFQTFRFFFKFLLRQQETNNRRGRLPTLSCCFPTAPVSVSASMLFSLHCTLRQSRPENSLHTADRPTRRADLSPVPPPVRA